MNEWSEARAKARATVHDRQVEDVKLQQRVNAAYRDAFAEKYPGQVEHCLRLVMERLHAGLDKRDGVDITRPDTWKLNTMEIAELARAASILHGIRNELQNNAGRQSGIAQDLGR